MQYIVETTPKEQEMIDKAIAVNPEKLSFQQILDRKKDETVKTGVRVSGDELSVAYIKATPEEKAQVDAILKKPDASADIVADTIVP